MRDLLESLLSVVAVAAVLAFVCGGVWLLASVVYLAGVMGSGYDLPDWAWWGCVVLFGLVGLEWIVSRLKASKVWPFN